MPPKPRRQKQHPRNTVPRRAAAGALPHDGAQTRRIDKNTGAEISSGEGPNGKGFRLLVRVPAAGLGGAAASG